MGLSAGGHRQGQPDGVGLRHDARNPLQSQLTTGANNRRPASRWILIGGLLFANRGGPKAPYKSDWNNIQPRIGFSYRINEWLIGAQQLRPLVSRSLERRPERHLHHRLQRSTPFVAFAPNGVDPRTPWANPFPDGFLQPLAGELGLRPRSARASRFPIRDFEIPYTDQWMAGVDVQLPWNIGLDVAYVGNKVSKLGVSRGINEIPQSERDKSHSELGGNATTSTRRSRIRSPACSRDTA